MRSSRCAGRTGRASRRFGRRSSRSPTGWRRGRSPGAAGLEGEDRGRFDRKYIHVETLVVGGGPAGRAAAAAERDGRVLLVDEGPVVEPIDGVDVLPRATALGIYDHGYVLVAERRPGHRTEGRLWHIRAGRIVLASRRHRAADPVPRQRPAGGHAGGRGRCLRGAVWRPAGPALRVWPRRTIPGSNRRRCSRTPARSSSTSSTCVGATASTAVLRTCRSCPAAGTRTLRSGRRRAAASGSTIGSAHTSRMASCGTSRSSDQRPATGYRTAPRPRGTAPATRTRRSSTWNGTRPWPTSVVRWAQG